MSSKNRARGKNTVNTKKKLKDLPKNKRNKIWSDEEMNIHAHVLANTDTAERSWLYQLENYGLKKHARKHGLLMAQLLLQPRPHNMNMQHANYRNSYSHD